MTGAVIVDTGAFVAAFDRRDARSQRAASHLKTIRSPMLTCEPVLAETWFLLRRAPEAWERLTRWIDRGIVVIDFDLASNAETVFALMRKYRDLPMSLADACLVSMFEQGLGDRVFTFDHHFALYRTPSRRKIKTLGLEK